MTLQIARLNARPVSKTDFNDPESAEDIYHLAKGLHVRQHANEVTHVLCTLSSSRIQCYRRRNSELVVAGQPNIFNMKKS